MITMGLGDIILLVIIQVGTFAALIVVLRILFYQHLNSAVRRLKKLQEEALVKEASLREELERAKQERLAEVERGKAEAKNLLEKARVDLDALRSKTEDQAKQESEKIIDGGREEVKKMRAQIAEEVKTQGLDLAVKMINFIFSENTKEGLHHQLIEEVIDEIEKLDKKIFNMKSGKVQVISSFPLNDKERDRLKKVLDDKVKFKTDFKAEVDKELIAGFIVRIGEFVIDGSFKNKLRKVIPLVKKD